MLFYDDTRLIFNFSENRRCMRMKKDFTTLCKGEDILYQSTYGRKAVTKNRQGVNYVAQEQFGRAWKVNHLALKSPAWLALQRVLWRRFFFLGVNFICKIIKLLLSFRTWDLEATRNVEESFLNFPQRIQTTVHIFFVCVSTCAWFQLNSSIFESGPMPTQWNFLDRLPVIPSCWLGQN